MPEGRPDLTLAPGDTLDRAAIEPRDDELILFLLGDPETGEATEAEREAFVQRLYSVEAQRGQELVCTTRVQIKFIPGFYQDPRDDLFIFMLGDKARGLMPDREEEENFRKLLAFVDNRPGAVIVYHFGLEVVRVPGYYARRREVQRSANTSP